MWWPLDSLRCSSDTVDLLKVYFLKMCVCRGTCSHVCFYMQCRFFFQSSLFAFVCIHVCTYGSAHLYGQMLRGQRTFCLASSPSYLPIHVPQSTEVTGVHGAMPSFITWVLGSQPRLLCLHSEHLMHWSLSVLLSKSESFTHLDNVKLGWQAYESQGSACL